MTSNIMKGKYQQQYNIITRRQTLHENYALKTLEQLANALW